MSPTSGLVDAAAILSCVLFPSRDTSDLFKIRVSTRLVMVDEEGPGPIGSRRGRGKIGASVAARHERSIEWKIGFEKKSRTR